MLKCWYETDMREGLNGTVIMKGIKYCIVLWEGNQQWSGVMLLDTKWSYLHHPEVDYFSMSAFSEVAFPAPPTCNSHFLRHVFLSLFDKVH